MSVGVQFLDDLRVVVRLRDFRRLFVTRLVAQAGDGVFETALGSLFFFSPQRAATASGVAAAISVAILPYTLVGPFAGVLLDRWSRRQVLVRANLVRVVLVLVVAAMVDHGAVGLTLYAVVLGCLSVNRFFLAGLGASLPHVVPRSELVMANAVSPTSGTLIVLLGGGLGFGLRTALGAGDRTDAAILVLAAGFYAAAALFALRMRPDLLGPDADHRLPWHDVVSTARGVVSGLRDAGRHVRQRRAAFDALAVIGAQRFGFGLVTVTVILLCRGTFADPGDVDSGARHLAGAFLASGIGLFLAAVVTPMATRVMSAARWVVCCSLAASLLSAIFASTLATDPDRARDQSLGYAIALVSGLGLGVAAQGSKICVDAIVQGSVDDAFRGRVMSFYDMVFNVAFVSAAAVCALTVPSSGRSPGLFAGVSAVYLAAGLLYARASGVPRIAAGDGVTP